MTPRAKDGQTGGSEDVNVLLALARIEKLPHNQHVAVADEGQGFAQTHTVDLGAGSLVLEHPAASGRSQSVELQRGVLVRGADTGIADLWPSAVSGFSRTKRAGLGSEARREHMKGTHPIQPLSEFLDQAPFAPDPDRSHRRSGSAHTRHPHHRRQPNREHGCMPQLWSSVAPGAQHLPAPAAGPAVAGPCRRDPGSRTAVPLPRPDLCPPDLC